MQNNGQNRQRHQLLTLLGGLNLSGHRGSCFGLLTWRKYNSLTLREATAPLAALLALLRIRPKCLCSSSVWEFSHFRLQLQFAVALTLAPFSFLLCVLLFCEHVHPVSKLQEGY